LSQSKSQSQRSVSPSSRDKRQLGGYRSLSPDSKFERLWSPEKFQSKQSGVYDVFSDQYKDEGSYSRSYEKPKKSESRDEYLRYQHYSNLVPGYRSGWSTQDSYFRHPSEVSSVPWHPAYYTSPNPAFRPPLPRRSPSEVAVTPPVPDHFEAALKASISSDSRREKTRIQTPNSPEDSDLESNTRVEKKTTKRGLHFSDHSEIYDSDAPDRKLLELEFGAVAPIRK